MPASDSNKLKKELGLFDVFAISTGAMFSSGFFLLPGLAAAKAGPSVFVAYLIAGILILPAMFSVAELSTALPRAGGAYYFLDRSLGSMVGTIGGLGTYFALTLKTAFALIGIGAYAAFFIELPIKTVAVSLTFLFMLVNVVGAKETTALQRILVAILLTVLAFFLVQGTMFVSTQDVSVTQSRIEPFLPFGLSGLLSTVGFVFVSYAGLTKVASVAEEIKNPDRNIPLGMILSLTVTSVVYVVGVFIMVSVLDPVALQSDLTPVATAAESFFTWLPGSTGLFLVVAAALAAFASTGNAGLLSASRYPLAMARDRLLPDFFARIGRFRTPTLSIVTTGFVIILFILTLDEEGIAKLASAFQLFIFVLLNLSVLVMRESRIQSYDPGYRSPLYPWMQIFGIFTSLVLIAYMGWIAILFTVGVVALCLIWYFNYARNRVERHGAIYHWFQRLGQRRNAHLDIEFRGIMKEKGLRTNDPFEEIVARSIVLDVTVPVSFEDTVGLASERLSKRLNKTAGEISESFLKGTLTGNTPVAGGVALPHFRSDLVDSVEIVLLRSKHPVSVPVDDPLTPEREPNEDVNTIFFLVSPDSDPGQHLRILAQIAGRVDEDSFAADWLNAQSEQELREVLLRDERFLTLRVDRKTASQTLVGKALREIALEEHCLVALIQRDGDIVIPTGKTVLLHGDRLTIIGEPNGLRKLGERYG
ncbi:MAG: amino acid permease [Rhodothermales bacterium]|nr:amino acid permease [Rhodothermales bacterium]